MDEEREERINGLRRSFFLLWQTPEESLPPPHTLRAFIRKLQQNVKVEAMDLIAEEAYENAFSLLTLGIDSSSVLCLDGYSLDTQNDIRLLVLRSQCANNLGYFQEALSDAEKALAMDPNSVPAKIELLKVKNNIAMKEDIPLERLLKADLLKGLPEMVREHPEVKDILRQLGLQNLKNETKQKSDSQTFNAAWIPSHNREIAMRNKSSHSFGKRRKIKQISDGAEPVFPITGSYSSSQWLKQGAKPKTAGDRKTPEPASRGSTKPTQKQTGRATERKGTKHSAQISNNQKTQGPEKTKGKVLSPCTASVNLASLPSFHRDIKYVCGVCYARGKVCEQRQGSQPQVCAGSSGSHSWQQCRMIVVYSRSRKRWCKVRRRHESLSPNAIPNLCIYGDACKRHDCWFPHFQEEADLWAYMGKHKLTKLGDVLMAGRAPSNVITKAPTTCKVKHAKPSPQPKHHCSYCDIYYLELSQLQQHITSETHRSRVNSDEDRKGQWKYRSPPWDVVNGQYQECLENKTERCMFTSALENNCTKAHSNEELQEWKERHKYRMMKMRKAKDKQLYAFMDDVLDRYNFSPSRGEDVITDRLLGVRVDCSEDFNQYLDVDKRDNDSPHTCTWSLTLDLKASENKSLKRVCLLYDDNRPYFRLSKPPKEREAQVCPGNLIAEEDGRTYRIDVIFRSQILGSFSQWVLFDLGTEPYLVRKLQVVVGLGAPNETFDEINGKQRNTCEVWDDGNSEIVRFYEDSYQLSSTEVKLLADYVLPISFDIDNLGELSRDNYREYMHAMLYLEEKECNTKISKFASESTFECLDRILLETPTATVMKNAVGGSKFGKVDLKRALMDDSETSQIIERNVHKMMLKFGNSKKVYEAIILPEQDYFGKQNQDTLYVKLSPLCVEELDLQGGTTHRVEIQLHLNRLPLCYMHLAVDRLQNMDMVFPPIGNPHKIPPVDKQVQKHIDPHQERAVKFISRHKGKQGESTAAVGPVLVCGPFGTGKTHTLATAVKRTLEAHADSKILICTHSNSAADLYITEHLHKLVEAGEIKQMIRVYTKIRDIKTIAENVRKYTKITDDKVQTPTLREIKASSVVITTLTTSHTLDSTELYGHFTHILIDEAGQALETEVLQPLTLATANTCVVLAGDHLQICPKVFSRVARHAKFHVSLLERLFYQKVGRVLLSKNYRTCQKMLDFISRTFYYGNRTKQKLEASFNREPHPKFMHPLVFYAVKGEDEKIGMSYSNDFEVTQIVQVVQDLCYNWPENKWGKLETNSISVVASYKMQVTKIRELRKKSLGSITVETVQNVQGKQYQVLIISTVRTRRTLNKVDTTAFVSQLRPANRPEDTFDYGFLSDARLLNTACTRAQSLLVVVGDPSTLCSVGDCSKIWRSFLQECHGNNTLLPLGTTIEGIQQEMESAKQRLNPFAAAFEPAVAKTRQPPPKVQAPRANEISLSSGAVSKPPNNDPWLPGNDSSLPDGIMRELYRQISHDERRLKRSKDDSGVDPEKLDDAEVQKEVSTKWKRKPPKFRMVEQGDRIVLDIRYSERHQKQAEEAEEADSEEGLRNDKHDESERQIAYKNVEQRPDKFKRCVFHCENSGYTYAVPLDEGLSGKITITSKIRRGRALNLDQVIVEIFDNTDDSETLQSQTKYGQVICICKRAAGSTLTSKVVCKLDEYIDNQMVPIDRTLPKFFVLARDERKRGKGNTYRGSPDSCIVSIYRYSKELQEDSPFLKNVEVSRKDREHKLFVVEYVKWFAKAPYPMGLVTEELPQADTKEKGLRILKLIHGVKDDWKPEIMQEVENQFSDEWEIPQDEIQSRYDARHQFVFTIDPPESLDLDDALSVERDGENYKIGIHIADVSYFVSKDSTLDREARNRSTSFYPHPSVSKPINMLPSQLSNRLCSLLPQKDRLTISVFATLNKSGHMMADVEIVRSVIRSRKKLTYSAVEEIITSSNDEHNNNITIAEKILTLNKLAKERRRSRLGLGRFAFSHDAEEEVAQHPLAHSLVEEMMLLANQAVATFLVRVYPDCSPLRRQLAPSEENIETWFENHAQDLVNSLELQSRGFSKELQSENSNDVHILKEKWNDLLEAVGNQRKITTITDLITSDENHPQLAVARADLFVMLETADYISSGDHTESSKRNHFSLNMAAYTHFTSPIRRYFDLVVHRMLISAINDEKAQDTLHQSERPYTTDELASISHHCNIQQINSQTFERKTRALQCALRLKEAPQSFKVFVGGFSDSSLKLIFPYRRFLPSTCPLNILKPISKPQIEEGQTKMELQWKERIYELRRTTTPQPRLVSLLTLDTDQMTVKISADHWKEILGAVQTENTHVIHRAVTDADEEQELKEREKSRRQRQRGLVGNQNLLVEEVTCESLDANKPFPFVHFQRSFRRGDVVKVQLNASVQRGILSPCLQLVFLTPKLSLCAEHRGNSIESFAKVAEHRPSAKIDSTERYKAIWLPILRMISAHNAVVSDESCVIHDVNIDWHCTEGIDQSPKYNGMFKIKTNFCNDRGFEIHKGDYVCLCYRDLPLTPKAKSNLRMIDCTNTPSPTTPESGQTTFIAHALITALTDKKKNTEDWTVEVHVGVNQHSAPFPDVLFERHKKVRTCTIELIPKSNSDGRLESAVAHLHNAQEIVQGICTRQIPAVNNGDPVIRRLLEAGKAIKSFSIPGSPFPLPNESQQAALRKALQRQFTVIQGPPGTGKTVTGAHLTYFFVEVNKHLPDLGRGPPQVLYCGPSNKAVDVVADYMLRLSIPAIRVYNNMIEQQDFPIPGHSGRILKAGSSKETKMDPKLRFISLHHLIRQPSNNQSEHILAFEREFHNPGYKIAFDDLETYRRTIHKAEAEELQKFKVVLCTCNEAGSIRIQRNVNAIQCIVDEAGMCNEPETLIPLVGTIEETEDPQVARKKDVRREPRQVVLIGDHKQLRPIIQERTAIQLGMETSLLEKYGKEAIMLTIQYRMHQSICAFPSEMFYTGKLVTADSVKKRPQQLNRTWPGGQGNPLVFCHHVGIEEKQSVRTEEGGEQSRANPEEVDHVVRIALAMVKRLGVKQDRIVVLTQYRLQRTKIEDRLRAVHLEDIIVSTVITSQGKEWDYVILSTVRSLPRVEIDEKPSTAWKKRNLGFITDENQINVAITRPRLGLIILGNKFLLRVHPTWKKLLSHYEEKKALVEAKDFPK
ncbi:helicase with zinc finger domain 2-like isoform X2 [Acanthaster planci]|uniref:Helicase with zinc finger domain 2-like isoform X2 n=1 Tax=Acanthaster planci TaxID=133434 RepID=A0A8B7ZWN7_ACAPL|nr:helicase with zinc finger domain 2-like isoform X2 [Acanthaster planci]